MRWQGWLVFVGLALLTDARVMVWSSDVTLWREVVQTSPNKPRGWVNYGKALAVAGENDWAQAAYDRALVASADPRRSARERQIGRTTALLNLGLLLVNLGEADRARPLIQEARRLSPTRTDVTRLCVQVGCSPPSVR